MLNLSLIEIFFSYDHVSHPCRSGSIVLRCEKGGVTVKTTCQYPWREWRGRKVELEQSGLVHATEVVVHYLLDYQLAKLPLKR